MKKIYLVFLSLILATSLIGQTYLSEDFSGGSFPPSGWAYLPLGDIWSASSTSNAGGSAPEVKFSGSTSPGTARLISPAIDLSEVDTVILTFKHFYEDLPAPGPSIGVSTRAGDTWESVWETTPTSTQGPEEIQLILTGGDVGAYNFQLSFYVTGSLPNLQAWYVDDIVLSAPAGLDAKMSAITTPGQIQGPAPVGGIVTNMGNTVVNELTVAWESFGGMISDTNITDLSLGLLDTQEINFDGMWVQPFGTHIMRMWIVDVNGGMDDNQDNDTISKAILYIANEVPKMPVVEEFTSSTCAPCASFNASFVPWSLQHEDDIVLVKYQMNWPGSGDPYYTQQGGDRRNYYGVSGVPDVFFNGGDVATSTGALTAALAAHAGQTSTLDIASSFTISGTNINLTTNILPFSDAGQYRVINVLFEKITTGNVASNGETEFHHVMMRMFPDAYGANINFQDRVPVTLNYTYDLSTTNVEELDDLEVAVIIQNYSTKEIVQSEYGLYNVSYSSEARLSGITLDGEPLEGFDPDVLEYDVMLPEGTIVEPVLDATAMDDGALVVITQAFELPGTAVVDVYAENRYNSKRYLINYDIATGLDDKEPVTAVQIYPNPAQNQLFITGLEKAAVKIFSSDGKLVVSQDNFNGNAIDVSKLTRGVYILNVVTENANVIKRKVVIL